MAHVKKGMETAKVAQLRILIADVEKKHDASFIAEKFQNKLPISFFKEIASTLDESYIDMLLKRLKDVYDQKSTKPKKLEKIDEPTELSTMLGKDVLVFITSFLFVKDILCAFALICRHWLIASRSSSFYCHSVNTSSLFVALENQMRKPIFRTINQIRNFDLRRMTIDASSPSIAMWFANFMQLIFPNLHSLTLLRSDTSDIFGKGTVHSYDLFSTLSNLTIQGFSPNLSPIFERIYEFPKLTSLSIVGAHCCDFDSYFGHDEANEVTLDYVLQLTLDYVGPTLFARVLSFFSSLKNVNIELETDGLYDEEAESLFEALATFGDEMYAWIRIDVNDHNYNTIVNAAHPFDNITEQCEYMSFTLDFTEDTENDYLKYIDLQDFLENKAENWQLVLKKDDLVLKEFRGGDMDF